jgi:hypothetical protein
MFFEEEKNVIDFFFNQLIDAVVYKPLSAEERGLHKWIDEGDIVSASPSQF